MSLLALFVLCLLSSVCSTFSLKCQREVPITGVERIGLGVLVNPETIVVDSQGYLYTGINDGSIKRVDPSTLVVTTYAVSTPSLTNRTGCGLPLNEPTCGRVLGLVFDSNDNLYVADAYKGLLLIPRNNVSDVRVLSTSSGGIPFRFTNALALNEAQDTIYFTDTSPTDYRYNFVKILLENKPQGRFLKYDIATGATTTLLTGLYFANGVSFNSDYRYVAINELGIKSVRRYWVRSGLYDALVNDIGGYNDNIEFDRASGKFLVGLFSEASEEIDFIQSHQNLASVVNTYVSPQAVIGIIKPQGVIKQVTQLGNIDKVLVDKNGTSLAYVAEARHIGSYIYVGSVVNPFLARIPASLLDQPGRLACLP